MTGREKEFGVPGKIQEGGGRSKRKKEPGTGENFGILRDIGHRRNSPWRRSDLKGFSKTRNV